MAMSTSDKLRFAAADSILDAYAEYINRKVKGVNWIPEERDLLFVQALFQQELMEQVSMWRRNT